MLDHIVEPPRVVRRLEVITGAGGRRRWSAAEKARIVEEAMAPGAVVSAIARRHGLSPQHLFTWRRQARRALNRPKELAALFVPAVIEAPSPKPWSPVSPRPHDAGRQGTAAGIELEIAGVVVRVGPEASEATITAVIRALKASARSRQRRDRAYRRGARHDGDAPFWATRRRNYGPLGRPRAEGAPKRKRRQGLSLCLMSSAWGSAQGL